MPSERSPRSQLPRLQEGDLVTLAEAARLARAPISSVRAWCRDGRLPSVRPARRRLVLRRDLAAFLLGDR